MRQTTERDKVIFRVDKAHNFIFALFPEIPASPNGLKCRHVNRFGIQGEADITDRLKTSRSAKPEECSILASLLTSLGYNLWPVTRETKAMREVRKASASFGGVYDTCDSTC